MSSIPGLKYLWKIPQTPNDACHAIAQQYNISIPIAQTIISREIPSKQPLDNYFFGTLSENQADTTLLKDAQKAVQRIKKAIDAQEKILICGDYDVDGITSSSLMLLLLKPLGADINFFLPHRVKDGYGLSVSTVERAAKNNYSLIITVDNGITAFDAARKAQELGIDLIITDHHKPHAQLPPAYAIVNPHQSDCAYPFKYFAGVGVSFKLLSLLYENLARELPPKAYELLLFGTVADVVPLTGENRYLVRHGLQIIHTHSSYALEVLKKNGNVQKPVISSTDIGFNITPQINALGRLEDARQGVRFLIGTNRQETEEIGSTLAQLNKTRKELEKKVLHDVVETIERGAIDLKKERIILAGSDAWPVGVIGLVASRLVSMYARPVVLLHTSASKAKGSCRSINGFNMFHALDSAKDILDTYGGHAAAAGLSLSMEKLPLLKEHLEKLAYEQLTPYDLEKKITIDAQLPLSDVNKKLMHDLHLMEPFGCENSIPVFHIKNVTLMGRPLLLKDAHVKCSVFADGIIKPVIFFNYPQVYEWLEQNGDKPFDIAAQVTQNIWQDKVTIELIGLDVSPTPL